MLGDTGAAGDPVDSEARSPGGAAAPPIDGSPRTRRAVLALAILPLAYLVRSLPMTGRSAVAGLAQVDPALEEAASSLGAGRFRTQWRVVLPLLRPALAAGAALAFITGLGDFVASVILYTLDTRPISIEILSSLRVQDLGAAAVYGVLLAVVSGVAFFAWGEGSRTEGEVA